MIGGLLALGLLKSIDMLLGVDRYPAERDEFMGKGQHHWKNGNSRQIGFEYNSHIWTPKRPAHILAYKPAMGVLDMLQYSRPYESNALSAFITKFLAPLGASIDEKGNCMLRIGTAPVMWSCHTDTVGKRSGHQSVSVKNGFAYLTDRGKFAGCLGGDDTCGVWIMVEMIKRQIPGLYIFHAGEEVGCVGSRHISLNNKELVAGIKFAIAIDRREYNSVITRQRGGFCCSQEFAASLVKALDFDFKADPTGTCTDTAQYVDLIGECTNLSSGYFSSHSVNETVDLHFLTALLDKLCKLDISQLVEKRKPGEPGYKSEYSTAYTSGYVRNVGSDLDDYMGGYPYGASRSSPWHRAQERLPEIKPRGFLSDATGEPVKPGEDRAFDPPEEDALENETLEVLCKEFPEIASDILEQMGYDSKKFMDHIVSCYEKIHKTR